VTVAAFYVGTIEITDPVRWREYVSQVGETITQHGGEILFRGIRAQSPENQRQIVVLRFVDESAANTWFASSDYQRLIPIRDAAARVDLVLYNGQA
jgi:uncharacterized protein (DUF1330 family)